MRVTVRDPQSGGNGSEAADREAGRRGRRASRCSARQAEADTDERDDHLITDERTELAALRRENAQLKRANESCGRLRPFSRRDSSRPAPGDRAQRRAPAPGSRVVLTTLEYALASRQAEPGKLIHHADHGQAVDIHQDHNSPAASGSRCAHELRRGQLRLSVSSYRIPQGSDPLPAPELPPTPLKWRQRLLRAWPDGRQANAMTPTGSVMSKSQTDTAGTNRPVVPLHLPNS